MQSKSSENIRNENIKNIRVCIIQKNNKINQQVFYHTEKNVLFTEKIKNHIVKLKHIVTKKFFMFVAIKSEYFGN